MPGFPDNDHKRVSNATVWVERNKDNKPLPQESDPKQRGLVRVMLLDDINFGDIRLPNPVQGDFPTGEPFVVAAITKQSTLDNYVVRCMAADEPEATRTWQLRLIPPERGVGVLTSPIAENATADEVEDAINATGCPPVQVAGRGRYVTFGETLRELPPRQWHIQFPFGNEWLIQASRYIELPDGNLGIEYAPGPGEVPIRVWPTIFEPTGFAELVWAPYHLTFATPTPGTFALCQTMPGLGLMIVDKECWSYVG